MNGFKFNCVKHNICKEKSNYHDDRFVDVKFRSSYENIEIYVKIISWYWIILFMIILRIPLCWMNFWNEFCLILCKYLHLTSTFFIFISRSEKKSQTSEKREALAQNIFAGSQYWIFRFYSLKLDVFVLLFRIFLFKQTLKTHFCSFREKQ